jgi:hypothetical protein
MPTRSPEEWQALTQELKKIVHSPHETRERKRKAQSILDSMYRDVGPLSYTEYMRRREGPQRNTLNRNHSSEDEEYRGIV